MTLTVALHDPTEMSVNEFKSGSRLRACITIHSEFGGKMDVYTTPEIARAVAEAFAEATAPEEDEEGDYIATPEDFALEGADLALMRRYEDGA